MAQNYIYPPSGSSASSNASVGPNAQAIPSSSTLIAGKNGSGNQTPVSTDASGNVGVNVQNTPSVAQSGTWNITNVSGTVSLPTGAATSANQTTGNTSLATIATNTGNIPAKGAATTVNSTPVNIASDQTVPVSATSLPLPTGAATSANQTTGNASLSSIDSKTPSLGQALAAGSVPVVLPATQITALTPPTTITANQGTGGASAWKVDGSGVTQPVSGTVALGTGSNTIGAVTQASGPWSQNLTQIGGSAVTLGQKVMASSLPVTIASDQAVISTKAGGKTQSNAPVYNLYSTTNVTTSAYVQLVASLTTACTEIEIFDSSGSFLYLATGGSGSESNQIIISPGGNGRVPLAIAAGTRVSIKAVDSNATSGAISINFYA